MRIGTCLPRSLPSLAATVFKALPAAMLEQLPDVLGEALGEFRAGLDQTLFHAVDLRQGMAAINVGSLAFADHAPMPEKYTADGVGSSPPLHWSGVPAAATEVVLIVEDADSPTPHPLVHAIAVGLGRDAGVESLAAAVTTGNEARVTVDDYSTGALAEGALSSDSEHEPTAVMGRNSLMGSQWLPPDPPPGHGVHRYVFQIYALEAGEALPESPGRDALRQAVLARGLASGCLIGTYERPSGRIDAPLATAPLASA